MHPSESVDWSVTVQNIVDTGYTGPLPTSPCWFGDSAELSAQLILLVLSGSKTATASLVWEWEYDGEQLPIIGHQEALLDWSNKFVGIIQTTTANILPFNSVSERFAALEGEGDLSLSDWRKQHWDFFQTICNRIGKPAEKDMPVLCQEFKLVYKKT
jgi:uncharacterized protein YhfF